MATSISTHTLTWSVTIFSVSVWTQVNFNSHAHVERDFDMFLITTKCKEFQLTRSRGAWLNMYFQKDFPINFNSHAHVERDKFITCSSMVSGISTHTLTWSVTTMWGEFPLVCTISTHTLTWSVTLKSWILYKPLQFQLTRSRGAWPFKQKRKISI